ncbi:MAG: magnesium transporter [Myxococcales bacterium]|nr:magnesium transporter [Myxococcales bacterium]
MTLTLTPAELRASWPGLSTLDRVDVFRHGDRVFTHDLFITLPAPEQAAVLLAMEAPERRVWFRLLPPDDAADLIQELGTEHREPFLELLDPVTRGEVRALLAYADDDAAGLMTPRFARLRPDMTVNEALRYLQRQAREKTETIYCAYVLGPDQRLMGVVSFRDLFTAPEGPISQVMRTKVVTVPETMDQEAVAKVIARHDLHAVPVVDTAGRMKGIVTVDDIVDVLRSEATEDIQKLGGMEALESPYFRTTLLEMVRKRAGWLTILFVGEMLTTNAMARYEDDIAKAVVLALFVPLIISSGGNTGSQASTLIIRSMALGEVGLGDWSRVVRRELIAGLVLGAILATLGLLRIVVGQTLFGNYGAEWLAVGATVAVSLVGVVTWGTIVGSMLPFAIRRAGFDPASASAPFVATLVDVSGLILYFTVGSFFLNL